MSILPSGTHAANKHAKSGPGSGLRVRNQFLIGVWGSRLVSFPEVISCFQSHTGGLPRARSRPDSGATADWRWCFPLARCRVPFAESSCPSDCCRAFGETSSLPPRKFHDHNKSAKASCPSGCCGAFGETSSSRPTRKFHDHNESAESNAPNPASAKQKRKHAGVKGCPFLCKSGATPVCG